MQCVEPTNSSIKQAAERLLNRELVAFPTETVYGLGGIATDGIAVAKIFEMKGRPSFNPLIIHVASLESAMQYGQFNHTAYQLADQFWPGPLTIIVPRKADSELSDLASAGLDSIAIRIPEHSVAQSLLSQVNAPLAAPSANISGHVSPTAAQHVMEDFRDKDLLILDGGPTQIGIESTVISCVTNQVQLLRPGGVVKEDLERFIDTQLISIHGDNNTNPVSPGQLSSHYAPNAHIRLNATSVSQGEGLLAFGDQIPDGVEHIFNLSEKADLREAAANLFSGLRQLDLRSVNKIAVMPIPDYGLGVAINDRLKRAAAPR